MYKYKNIIFVLLLIIFYCPNIILAQPYYFERGSITESTPNSSLYEINRINLSNGITNIFLYYGLENLTFDQTQTWVANGGNHENYIYNYLDTTNYFMIDTFNDDMLFSESKNMIYIFCWDSNFINKQLAVYNVSQRQKTAFLNLPINSDIWNEAFFSYDENMIYFTKKDSAYGAEKIDNTIVEYYSTINNQINPGPKLSSIGYPNANVYDLYRGRQGKGIIQSYIKNQTKDCYYNIYDFDNNISTNFILHTEEARPFFSANSKYLLLAEQGWESLGGGGQYYNTGVLKIYNVANSSLIKTIAFPARGTFFMSDNYPSNIYYIGPINNRIIKNINIDSLIQQTFLPVKLVDSHGINLTTGSLQYYDSTWQNAVNNNDGTFLVNTTRKKVNLKMTYANSTQTLSNVTVGGDTIVFKTVNTSVQLENSRGNPLDTGIVQFYSGGWLNFGTTANGITSMELLPNSYKFRMTYANANIDTQQNIGNNPNVVFQTVNTSVQLKNSQGTPIDTGTVQYYAGAWRSFGTTANGIANKELLPISYKFRMTYDYVSEDTTQNISISNTVNFSTVLCTISVKDSLGHAVNNADTKYYAGAWREIGLTSGGLATKELLPVSLQFRVISGKTQKDITQDLSVNNLVQFVLP
jgi:hypothetical protein